MRPFSISEITRELLESLTKTKSNAISLLLPRVKAEVRRLFDEIAVRDELCAVPILANYLTAPPAISENATLTIAKVMANRDSEQLLALDQLCRGYSEYSHVVWNWSSLRVGDLDRFRWAQALWGLFSFHPNGWVRQAAVEQIAASDMDDARV